MMRCHLFTLNFRSPYRGQRTECKSVRKFTQNRAHCMGQASDSVHIVMPIDLSVPNEKDKGEYLASNCSTICHYGFMCNFRLRLYRFLHAGKPTSESIAGSIGMFGSSIRTHKQNQGQVPRRIFPNRSIRRN